jgi:organic radical activating enzyme/predicted phosphodiesterase
MTPPPTAGQPCLLAEKPVLVFGGSYSNLQATEALFAAAAELGIPPERMICTGDVVAYGADAAACVRLLRQSGVAIVAGNCEERLGVSATDCGCGFAPGSTCDTLSTTWFAHAERSLSAADRAWMRALPPVLELRIGGRRLLVLHGGLDGSSQFVWASDAAGIDRQLGQVAADGVIGGHCGLPFTRIGPAGLWHNPGAIGMPANDGTSRGWFSVLTPSPAGLTLSHHALVFDAPSAAASMRAAGLPDAYAEALATGLWPACDVLPPAELGRRGVPYVEGTLRWAGGEPAAWPETAFPSGRERFADPLLTQAGERRASVPLEALRTLWFNTGTLCNVTCTGCYIESSPTNDRLVYLSRAEAQAFLAEARDEHPALAEIGFTGGEPFMNRDTPAMMRDALEAGYRVLVLTNAMRPMQRFAAELAALSDAFKSRITMRVSLDHHSRERHEAVRGAGSWRSAIEGLRFLAGHGFRVAVAGRTLWDEPEAAMRAGYQALFARLELPLDASDPTQLVLFPEMDAQADVPEITESCWSILGKQPGEVMCAGSRMVVKRRGSARPAVVSCTLLPYDEAFELGHTLAEASGSVSLNHRFCAAFCVLGGASCSPA